MNYLAFLKLLHDSLKRMGSVALAGALTFAGGGLALAAESVIYNFSGGSDGGVPIGPLVRDASGSLYGVTQDQAGPLDNGGVFKLTRPAPGQTQWSFQRIYSFAGGADGSFPFGLVLDSSGALYGVTGQGGGSAACVGGCGTIYKLTPPASAGALWTKATLYDFQGGADGSQPQAPMVFDRFGALYGATEAGGGGAPCSQGCGIAFKLTPPTAGQAQWTETVLHAFDGTDSGRTPVGGLVFDSSGALFGATFDGPTYDSRWQLFEGDGSIFRLTPPSAPGGAWSETTLHEFRKGVDGAGPSGELAFGGDGALYGTTAVGTPGRGGGVYRLAPPVAPSRLWTSSLLYSFTGAADGKRPEGGLAFGRNGALYGSLTYGAPPQSASDNGAVFQLSPPAAGQTQWTLATLHNFTKSPDGSSPYRAKLIFDAHGAIYGTTAFGGTRGTVFQIK